MVIVTNEMARTIWYRSTSPSAKIFSSRTAKRPATKLKTIVKTEIKLILNVSEVFSFEIPRALWLAVFPCLLDRSDRPVHVEPGSARKGERVEDGRVRSASRVSGRERLYRRDRVSLGSRCRSRNVRRNFKGDRRRRRIESVVWCRGRGDRDSRVSTGGRV